uniref:Uncharacterized protein n=1 Tax=Timema monikensis TaxID=170555 RepID=A0A7R9EGN0_9NEOP|nr:unnamed protein product [Timema monikensis]
MVEVELGKTILFDLPLQTGVRPSGWELRPSPQGLLLQQLLPLQSVGGKLQMSAHGTLSKMGEVEKEGKREGGMEWKVGDITALGRIADTLGTSRKCWNRPGGGNEA